MTNGEGSELSVSLADIKCVPCTGETPQVSPEEIAPLLARLEPGWAVEDGARLVKRYTVRRFTGAVAFVNAIAPVAEEEGHHPDLYVRWGEVRVYLWTHAIGVLSENDFAMAAKIDRVYADRFGT